jgi:cupin 2 domain-containing protein
VLFRSENEWVLVLKGGSRLLFDDGREVSLKEGDHITIPARKKHKVSWTDPDKVTVWVAVFYS